MPDFGYHVALVGASSLLGQEVKEVLQARSFPVRKLALLDDDEALGQLTEFQGEPAFIRYVTAENFEGADFAIFASTAAFTRAHWKLAADQGCHVIDLSGALEEEFPASLHAPSFDLKPQASSLKPLSISPHPAALAVATVLEAVASRFALARAVVNIFQPASERGKPGVDELHEQTVSLLSFRKIPQEIFDRQLAFDLLATGGTGMRPTLEEVEARLDRHVQALLRGRAPHPALRLVQASTFHGYSLSFYLELGQAVPASDLAGALRTDGLELRSAGEEAPSSVGAVGADEIVLGDLRVDRSSDRAFWLWGAADNLRLSALNTVRIVEEAVKTPQSHRGTEKT